MPGRGVADILFCLDASGSMQPCFDAVRRHIGDFLAGLSAGGQSWDWRVDFLAHRASETAGWLQSSAVFDLQTSRCAGAQSVIAALYGSRQSADELFTRDLAVFQRGLSRLSAQGDEAALVALDCCLDFPWRDDAGSHRIVIMLTDEAFETGCVLGPQRTALPQLIDKLQRLKILLYLVAPESAVFEKLAEVDKSEYAVSDRKGNGLTDVDFGGLMRQIGKSVSASQSQVGVRRLEIPRGIFGQATWNATQQALRGS
jgi:hypothetical protein